MWLLVAVVVAGGAIGSGAFLTSGGDDPSEVAQAQGGESTGETGGFTGAGSVAADTASLDAMPTDGDTPTGFGQFGGGQFGDGATRRFGAIGPISGTLVSIDGTGVTLATSSGTVDVAIAADTPVRLNKAKDVAGDSLSVGTEVVAILTRSSDGSLSATNIVVGGFGGGRARGGGGAGGFGGGQAADGTEFNAVPGTVSSFANNILKLDTADGTAIVSVPNDTPIQLTIPFSDATGEFAVGEQLTVLGQRGDDGTYTPFAVTSGEGGLGGLFGGRSRGGRRGGG
jgi:hypothetical protein